MMSLKPLSSTIKPKPLLTPSSLMPKQAPLKQMNGPKAGFTQNTFNTGLPTSASGMGGVDKNRPFNSTNSWAKTSSLVPPVPAPAPNMSIANMSMKTQTKQAQNQKAGSYGTQQTTLPKLTPTTPTDTPMGKIAYTPVDNGTSYTGANNTPNSGNAGNTLAGTNGTGGTTGAVEAAKTDTPYVDPLKTMRDSYLNTYNQTEQEKALQDALAKVTERQATIDAQAGLGNVQIEDQTIPMGFITGQQAALERRRTALQGAEQAKMVPLQTQLANLQAQRLAQQQMAEKQLGFATPTTTEVGGSLVQFDPITGTYKSVYSAPSSADGYTLNPGQARYDASGKLIAQQAALPENMTPYQAAQLKLERDKMAQNGLDKKIVKINGEDFVANGDGTYSKPNVPTSPTNEKVQRANDVISKIDSLLSTDDWKAGVGPISANLPSWASGKRNAAIANIEEIISSIALENLNLLKGPMSDKDILFIKDASAGLRNNMSEAAFQNQLNKIKGKFQEVINRAQVPDTDVQEFMQERGVDEATARASLLQAIQDGSYQPSFNTVGSDTNKAVSVTIPQSSKLAYVNNNPGNLRFIGQQGASQGQGGFAKFSSPQAGYQALIQDIESKKAPGGELGPQSTLAQFVNVYAPPSENATSTYISQMAQWLGVSPNTPISQINTQALAKVIARKESSTNIA